MTETCSQCYHCRYVREPGKQLGHLRCFGEASRYHGADVDGGFGCETWALKPDPFGYEEEEQ